MHAPFHCSIVQPQLPGKKEGASPSPGGSPEIFCSLCNKLYFARFAHIERPVRVICKFLGSSHSLTHHLNDIQGGTQSTISALQKA